MRAVVTRVTSAAVTVAGETVGEIGPGFLVLLGVKTGDGEAQAEKLADKITGLRIFEDEAGKMNRSLKDAAGSILAVSQFTLYGNCRHGRRPEFLQAAGGAEAEPLYEFFVRRCRDTRDERVLMVELTEEGRALRERAASVPGRIAGCIHLAPEEAGELYRLLYKILGDI